MSSIRSVVCAITMLGVGAVAVAEPPVNATLVGTWDGTPGSYLDVCVDGDYAYMPNHRTSDELVSKIYVLDISDPANPVLDETLVVVLPNLGVEVRDVKASNGLLFAALDREGPESVIIYDIRDPANRTHLATVTISGYFYVHNIFYDSGFLYIPGRPGGSADRNSVAVVDLTLLDPDDPPASPITTAKWIITDIGTNRVHDVTVRNGRLYAAAQENGLWVYDVSDVANSMPTLLGSVGGEQTHSMWPTDDGKFVVTGEERTGGGIKVYEMIDLGGSLDFVLRDSLAFPPEEAFSVHNQVIIGNRLYNSWYEKGLQVYDIHPVTGQLSFVASFDTTNCFGVYPFLGDDRIVLSDREDGLVIVALELPPVPPVPAVSPWGLTALAILSAAVGVVVFRRRRPAAAA